MQLNSKQIKHLRSLAHAIQPVVTIGQHGVTENVRAEIIGALKFHELIKIKLAGIENKDQKSIIEATCSSNKAVHIQTIGKIATIFKRNPNRIRINFPKI